MDVYETIPFENPTQYLHDLLNAEQRGRDQMRIRKLINKAKFPQMKTFEGYSFDAITFPESINPEGLMRVDFIEKKENVIMLGAVGTGKTHLATAMGIEACKRGMKVRFFRVSDLISTLQMRFQAGTLHRFQKELLNSDMLIIDEIGFVPFHKDGSELFFNLMSECYERLSVVATSNLEFSQWNTVFGDDRLTAALVDRLVHHAHILAFTGDSYRLKNALSHQS
ncbi:MAG: IS21-like element helper ATPase IstB [Thermoactinomyces sp.]